MAGRGVCFFFRGGTGRFFFFPRRDGAVVVFFRGGTGWLFFFFDETGRGGVFFFSRPGRDGCFWRWQLFWRDGAKSLHRSAKDGLNRPASRPCKALTIFLLSRSSRTYSGEIGKRGREARSTCSVDGIEATIHNKTSSILFTEIVL